MSIISNILEAFRNIPFTLKDAYSVNTEMKEESVRARIYEHVGIEFEKLGRGLYISKDENCLIVNGDGRKLDFLENGSIDCIIADHPWDSDSNKGGNKNFAKYDCFVYEQEDFIEKARVLKDGSFLCEIIPEENSDNYEYLYKIKQMAKKAGLLYYCKVKWKKGTFVAHTGRKAKNSEDIMIFSKGKARPLRISNGKLMSGCNMLPTEFNVEPVQRSDVIVQSEKPPFLFERLLEYLTKENELVLDQFAGGGAVGIACKRKNRKCILIEKAKKHLDVILWRLEAKNALEAF